MSDFDPTDTPAPGDTQSTNNAQGGVRKAWDAWTSDPANNAFLLQTGLALLQPRSPGQSGVGQFANAIGQGAEAGGRNVEAREAEQAQQAKQSTQQQEADARTTNAEAYKDAVKNSVSGKSGTSNVIKLQQDFNRWLKSPEDAIGATKDALTEAFKKRHPDVKEKADIINNPQYLNEARQLFTQMQGGVAEGSTESSPTAVAPAPRSPIPPPQMYNGRLIHIDPTRRAWVYQDGTPVQ